MGRGGIALFAMGIAYLGAQLGVGTGQRREGPPRPGPPPTEERTHLLRPTVSHLSP